MLRMSKLTDYAILVLAYLAEARGPVHSAADVAAHTRLSTATASKLLKALTRAGLVASHRGSHGGYELAHPADQITAADVIDALEGPVAITECSASESQCELEPDCRIGGALQQINRGIQGVLEKITLAQLTAAPEIPLRRMDLTTVEK